MSPDIASVPCRGRIHRTVPAPSKKCCLTGSEDWTERESSAWYRARPRPWANEYTVGIGETPWESHCPSPGETREGRSWAGWRRQGSGLHRVRPPAEEGAQEAPKVSHLGGWVAEHRPSGQGPVQDPEVWPSPGSRWWLRAPPGAVGDACPELQGGLSREAVLRPSLWCLRPPESQRPTHPRPRPGLGRKLESEAPEREERQGVDLVSGQPRLPRALDTEVLSKSLVGTGAAMDFPLGPFCREEAGTPGSSGCRSQGRAPQRPASPQAAMWDGRWRACSSWLGQPAPPRGPTEGGMRVFSGDSVCGVGASWRILPAEGEGLQERESSRRSCLYG